MATSKDEAMLSPDGQTQPDQNSSSSLTSTNQVPGVLNSTGDQVKTLEELARALSISDDQNAAFQRLLAKEQKCEIPSKTTRGYKFPTDSQYSSLLTVQSAYKSRKLLPASWVIAECIFQHTLKKPAVDGSPDDFTRSDSMLCNPNVVENEVTLKGINYKFPSDAQYFLDFNKLESVDKAPFTYNVKNPQLNYSTLFGKLSIDEVLDGSQNIKTASLVKPRTSSVASSTVQSKNVSKMNDTGVEAAANLHSNTFSLVQNYESQFPLGFINYYKYLTPTELILSSLQVISKEKKTLDDGDLEQFTYNLSLSRMAFTRIAEPKQPLENRKNKKHLFSCRFCDKSFKDKTALSLHMKTHDWSSDYKCETCGKIFSFQSSLLKHKLVHSDALDLTDTSIQPSERQRSEVQLSSCPFCHKNFVNKALLSQHMKYHEWSGTYKCDICSKVFNFQSALHKHMLIHERSVFVTKPKPFGSLTCEFCNKSYKSKSLLSMHMKSHECYNCGLTFKYQDTLRDHKLQCQVNPTGATTKDSGRRRNENQLLSCKFCDESFKNKAALFEHLKSHQWSDLYKCEICGKIFNFQSSLFKHKLEHSYASLSAAESQENPRKPELQCSSCLEYLPTDSLLAEHMKLHECEICGIMISPPKMLLVHKLRFHSDDPETTQLLSHLKL